MNTPFLSATLRPAAVSVRVGLGTDTDPAAGRTVCIWADNVTVLLDADQAMKLATDLYGAACEARPPRSAAETPAQSAALGRCSNAWQAQADKETRQAWRLDELEGFIEHMGLVKAAQEWIDGGGE